VSHWLTIEVFDGTFPASQWRYAHGESLPEAAVTNGVLDWEWHQHQWGVVLELRSTTTNAARSSGRFQP
jgi:hypothetical protein